MLVLLERETSPILKKHTITCNGEGLGTEVTIFTFQLTGTVESIPSVSKNASTFIRSYSVAASGIVVTI